MASVQGTLVGLTQAELSSIRAAALAAILANTTRGQSYSIAGRSFNFASLTEAQTLLSECNYALGQLTGARATSVIANFNPGLRP